MKKTCHMGRDTTFETLLALFFDQLTIPIKHKIMSHEKNRSCIDACNNCAVLCAHCYSACLREEDPAMMRKCIELCIECTDLCQLCVKYMATGDEHMNKYCALCAEICEACAAECSRHKHDHCRQCADACRRCAEECKKMAA
jgi:hypothetical protein